MKLRASALIAGAGKAQPMCNVGANAIVLKSPGRIKTKKSIIIANAPYFADGPDNAPLGLLEVWKNFGTIAASARGMQGKGQHGWSMAAENVHDRMAGFRSAHQNTGVGQKASQMSKIDAAIRRLTERSSGTRNYPLRQGIPELFPF